jgi:hypothetical protein
MSSDRRWSGGLANREWSRAAGQSNLARLPAEEEHELYLTMLDESFYCDACGGFHPMREHQQCRTPGQVSGGG